MGAHAARRGRGHRRPRLVAARLGPPHRQDPPRRQPLPKDSRLNNQSVVDAGPQPTEEHLYTVVDALDQVAAETGKTVPQIALNWLLRRPTVATLIIGARNEDQLKANLAATGWKLTPEQVATLDAASKVDLAYPYWHQVQFAERNPFPVPQG